MKTVRELMEQLKKLTEEDESWLDAEVTIDDGINEIIEGDFEIGTEAETEEFPRSIVLWGWG